MSWVNDLSRVRLPDGRRVVGASFRGVPFLVESSDRTGGRRVVVHQFPGRDVPFVEELGRAPSTIRIDGFVFGDDLATQRDQLTRALEDVSGPGELVHPRYGRVQAVCSGLTIRETTAEGRIARFQMDFQVQPELPVAPLESSDLIGAVDTSVATAGTASDAAFTELYDTADAPGYATASLQAELSDRTQGVRDALGRVVTTTAELARLDADVQSLVGQVTTLIRSPAAILSAFADVLGALTDTLVSAPGDVIGALLEAYDLPDQDGPLGSSAVNLAEIANLALLSGTLKRALLFKAAGLLPSVAFETTDDARGGLLAITSRIDALSLTATDAVYDAMQDLRGALTNAVPGDAVLARIITLSDVRDDPSLLLAYRLYGSVDRADEIVARNEAPDPAFLSGDLEALSR